MTIPIDSLLKLPPLASYSAKQGQANAKVSRDEGNIIVYASCDSLERLVGWYGREWRKYRQENESLTIESMEWKRTALELRSSIVKTFFAGFIIGIVLTIIFIKNKK